MSAGFFIELVRLACAKFQAVGSQKVIEARQTNTLSAPKVLRFTPSDFNQGSVCSHDGSITTDVHDSGCAGNVIHVDGTTKSTVA